MQKINSILEFSLEKQQTLESHDLKGHTHFWLHTPEYYQSNS